MASPIQSLESERRHPLVSLGKGPLEAITHTLADLDMVGFLIALGLLAEVPGTLDGYNAGESPCICRI